MFRFEKYEVWQKAVTFADLIYRATRAFPPDERFGLTTQLRRAAVSISANIAEGSGRGSDQDFARFVSIAYGSLMEVDSEAKVSRRLEFLSVDDHAAIVSAADELSRMLSGLKSTLLAKL